MLSKKGQIQFVTYRLEAGIRRRLHELAEILRRIIKAETGEAAVRVCSSPFLSLSWKRGSGLRQDGKCGEWREMAGNGGKQKYEEMGKIGEIGQPHTLDSKALPARLAGMQFNCDDMVCPA